MTNRIVDTINLLLDELDNSALIEVYNKVITRIEPNYKFKESLPINPSEMSIANIYYNDLKDEILNAVKYGYKDIDYVTECLNPSDVEAILGKGFKCERMTYDTLTISWDIYPMTKSDNDQSDD